MKIGTAPAEEVELQKEAAPPLPQEQPKASLLDDVLNEAAAKASATEEVHTPGFVFDEKVAAFFDTYRVSKADVGQTPLQIFQDLEHPDRVPDANEEEILDALIFEGRYQREFKLGKASFTLTTFSSRTERHARRYLQKVAAADPDGLSMSFNAMVVARGLVEFAGRQACQFTPDDPGFETEKALSDRVDFVMSLPTDVMDAIGSRVNLFLKVTSGVTARNLSDF